MANLVVENFRAQTCDQFNISRAVFSLFGECEYQSRLHISKVHVLLFLSLSLRLCFAFEVSWHLSAMCGDNVVVVCWDAVWRTVPSWGLIVNSSSKRQERTQLEGNLVVSRHVPCCVGIVRNNLPLNSACYTATSCHNLPLCITNC